jgi:leucyl aminopeptidase (aminopeptidase T)
MRRLIIEAVKAEPHVLILLPEISSGTDPFGLHTGYVGMDGRRYRGIMDKLLDGDRRIRGFWSNRVSADTFRRCVAVDYGPMRGDAARLKSVLDGGNTVRVMSPAGTDVEFSIKGRKAYKEEGDFSRPGAGGNLPSGEAYISPAIASARGTIVFDGTVSLEEGDLVPARPVRVKLEDGYVSTITGGPEAAGLYRAIQSGECEAAERGLQDERRNARHIGGFGIGLNPNATLIGNIIEDEKARGTAHFAIGNNFDNDAPALIHQDCIILSPSVWVDGRLIVKNGELTRF